MHSVKYIARAVVIAGTAATIAGLTSLTAAEAYSRVWEHNQPQQEIKGAIVTNITPYNHTSEITPPSSGYKIKINKDTSQITFEAKDWDKTVKVGDSIDLVVKRLHWLHNGGFDGIKIDDHK
ncbi:MAG TPA: hypothetical protein VJI97_02325 [Candidatus Nanoarchaeia archaeon]|nr:hypothetical protein [Candidatus Nanoarchaeia archaeon]